MGRNDRRRIAGHHRPTRAARRRAIREPTSHRIYLLNGNVVTGGGGLGVGAGYPPTGAADFNGDGRSDVLWRNGGAPTQHWIYLMNGNTIVGGGGVGVASGYSALMPW